MNFKRWLMQEFANYGFKDSDKRNKSCCEEPKLALSASKILDELFRYPPIGSLQGRRTWSHKMEWGGEVGSVTAEITPYGSFHMLVRRRIYDLEGKTRWICKKVIPIGNSQKEEDIAESTFQSVKKVKFQPLDVAERECPQFRDVCRKILREIARKTPSIMFLTKTKQPSENHFMFVFEFRGQGVAAPSSSRIEQFVIDLSFQKDSGLLYCCGTEISSSLDQHDWSVVPSEWNEHFAPGQDGQEIAEAVHTLLMAY